MKNFTIVAVLAAMAVPAFGSGHSAVGLKSLLKGVKEARTGALEEGSLLKGMLIRTNAYGESPMLKMSDMARKIKPETTKTYGWWHDAWTPEDTYTYTYDASGNVTVELCEDAEGDYARTVSEYNENGKVTFKETKTSQDGVNFNNNMKTEFEYDPILTNVITKRTEWMWMRGDWQLVGNNYTRTFYRNDDGNVTSVVIAVLLDGEYDPTQRLSITYGENGEAIEMAEQVLDYDGKEYFWEDGNQLTDIVWDRTDGQLYDIENIFIGANRIKSCHVIDEDGLIIDVTAEYADDSDAYTVTMLINEDGMSATATLKYTPYENDGGIIEQEISFMGTTIVKASEELRNDDWGLMTLYSVTEEVYGECFSEGTVGEVEYDAEGKPTVYTVSEYYTDEDTGETETEYIIRAEYSDYVDVTAGVGSIAAPASEERYYDLNGMPVSKPEKGSIVIRDGRKVKY